MLAQNKSRIFSSFLVERDLLSCVLDYPKRELFGLSAISGDDYVNFAGLFRYWVNVLIFRLDSQNRLERDRWKAKSHCISF